MGDFDYDAELRRYDQHLREAADVRPDDHVLDIGCGAGQTTRAAAQRAIRGSALGVDISASMLARAERASADVPNVRFAQADAQVHPFPPAAFTVGLSRFGTMFFEDPAAAFANVARALRPGARLVQLVWQHRSRQEWVTAIHRTLAEADPPSGTAPGDAFSLADPATVRSVLTANGFADVELADVREPVWYGPDPSTALDAVLKLREASDLLAARDAAEKDRALARLRAELTKHHSRDGVWFAARAWLVTARRT
ncbi:class I SAM-dependent methyltransferase [Amycolatopsis circi]|uniref:class I SAM-dependent methyltransferase n=1 Tax=Amycolatopsis circi TaxID=871959 RepID=UPI000E25614E|nr:class I SAM-dependent methyltransferase [Amycolatopsis circi]